MKPTTEPRRDGQSRDPGLEITEMPGHMIRRMHQASQAIFDIEVADTGLDLTPVQYAALSTIAAHPGLDQATLAAAIAFDRATTGGVVDRLEAKGLVRREIADGDRRSRRLFIETAGTRALAKVTPAVRRAQCLMLRGLSEAEARTLMRLLTKALASVGDVARPTSAAPLRTRPLRSV